MLITAAFRCIRLHRTICPDGTPPDPSRGETMGGMAFELTERIGRHLAGDQIAWLTTVTPAGRPAPRPVWFLWDGVAITVYSLNEGVKLRPTSKPTTRSRCTSTHHPRAGTWW